MGKYKFLIAILVLLNLSMFSYADDIDNIFDTDIYEETEGNDEPEEPSNPVYPARIPSRPIRCSINLSTNEVIVSSTLGGEIIRYEIWDADNTYCLFAASEAEDFCIQLGTFNQVVIIKLVTETNTYKGYIQL